MRGVLVRYFLYSSLLVVSGCSALTPEMVKELAKDNASVCIATDVRGGVGGIIGGVSGGYGQATATLCRSQVSGAKIEVRPDGTISIEHK